MFELVHDVAQEGRHQNLTGKGVSAPLTSGTMNDCVDLNAAAAEFTYLTNITGCLPECQHLRDLPWMHRPGPELSAGLSGAAG